MGFWSRNLSTPGFFAEDDFLLLSLLLFFLFDRFDLEDEGKRRSFSAAKEYGDSGAEMMVSHITASVRLLPLASEEDVEAEAEADSGGFVART